MTHQEETRRASCAMFVTDYVTLPPVLLIHSEHDPVVSVENSRTLHDCLATAGHEVTYYELAGCDAHGGGAFFTSQVLDLVQDFCQKQLKYCVFFMLGMCLQTGDKLG